MELEVSSLPVSLYKDEDNLAALLGCFTPCHLDVGTRAFEMRALDKQAMLAFNDVQIKQIKRNNMIIFEKCMCAIRNYGFSDNEISTALAYLKIYGMD